MALPTPPSKYEEQRLAQQRRNRKRALLLGGIFGISWGLVLLANLVPGLNGTVRGDWLALAALLVSFGVLIGGRQWRWERMRARLAPDVLAKDSRAPVVYLRSFAVDRRHNAFEGLLTRSLKDVGPIVAVGRPDEELPPGRIARAYVDDDQWQDRVIDLIGRARLVVMQIGTSEWLMWELIQAVHLLRPDQLLVFLGPERAGEDTNFRYQQFREQASPVFPRGLPDQIRGSGFITFGPDWTPIPSRDVKNNKGDYMNWVLQGLHRRTFRSSGR